MRVGPGTLKAMLQTLRIMRPAKYAGWMTVNPELLAEFVTRYQLKAFDALDALEVHEDDPCNLPGDEWHEAYSKRLSHEWHNR